MVDHRDLEQWAVGEDGLGDLADERHVVDDLSCDAPAHVADHHRIAEAEAEEVRWIDPRVEARDHEQAEVREHDGALVAAGGGKGDIARERGLDVRRVGLVRGGQLKAGGLCDPGASVGLERRELVVGHGVASPIALNEPGSASAEHRRHVYKVKRQINQVIVTYRGNFDR